MTQLGAELGAFPGLVGTLEIEVDDGWGSAGSTVIVPARVTNPGSHPVRVVLLVQGLAPSWCPPSQVLFLPAENTADVFLHLRPASGTQPGRYLWALTAQTPEHPLQAVTAQLLIRREPPPATPPVRRHPRRRRRILVAGAAGLLAVITAGVLVLTRHDRSPVPKPPTHHAVSPTPARTPRPTPLPVAVAGTVLAGEVGRITVTVVRLTLDDLSDQGHTTGTPVRAKVTIKGKQWTTSLPAGVYGMTFRQKGSEPASIVVDTTDLRWAAPPWVQLRPVSEQEGADQ
jgi:hypothetical protein